LRTVITHGHIFKNAGTTFDWSLQRNFGDGFLDHREDRVMRERGTAHLGELLQDQTQLRAVSSHHLCHRMPELSDCRVLPVYLLRHPLQRIASVYDFERRQQAETPGARAAKQKSFKDYVAWRMQPGVPRTIRNYQTIYLAGVHNYSDELEPGLDIFGTAMSTVRQTPLIGVVERYDESMVLMEHSLRDYFPDLDLSYVRQNVTRRGWFGRRSSSATSVLSRLGSLQQTVVDNNSLDLAIYQLVSRRLDGMIERYSGFTAHLQDFRRRCEELQRA